MADSAQALLQALDTGQTTLQRSTEAGWRAEDRTWRKEDLKWREEERIFRIDQRHWRLQDLEQRDLDNVRHVWERHIEHNKMHVEERAEQLRSVSNLSALIAGFAIVAMVEFQFNPDDVEEAIITVYAVLTSAVIGLNIVCMVTCNLLLAHILKMGKIFLGEGEEIKFVRNGAKYQRFVHGRADQFFPEKVRTFNAHWAERCQSHASRALYMFNAGVIFFLLSVVFIAWIKFNYSAVTAISVTIVTAVGILGWIHEVIAIPMGLTDEADLASGANEDEEVLGLPWDWTMDKEKLMGLLYSGNAQAWSEFQAGSMRFSMDSIPGASPTVRNNPAEFSPTGATSA